MSTHVRSSIYWTEQKYYQCQQFSFIYALSCRKILALKDPGAKEFFKSLGFRYQTCADPGIFGQGGGVQVNLTKKNSDNVFFLFVFSPQLILQKSNGYFQRKLSFFKVSEGSNIFQGGGGSNFFPGKGGGSNCLFPIETHITCDLQGGVRTPVPPLDPHLSDDSIGDTT